MVQADREKHPTDFIQKNEEPQSLKEALDDEYSSLISNEKWELVPPPKDANIVGSKWVLKVKRDADGNIN